MSGAKVAVVSPPVAPIIIGGAVVIGGVLVAGYLVKKGAEYGYVKVKYEHLKSDFKNYIKEIKLREDELLNKYNLKVNYRNEFEIFLKETIRKYETSIYEILSLEESDRKKVQEKLSNIREKLKSIELELKEIAKESDIYAEIIEKLEESNELKNELIELKILQQRIKEEPTITKRRAILVELKKDIECYEKRAFSIFMEQNSSNIKEEIFEKEHKSQKLKREIVIIVEKLKILEPNYQFKFNIKEENSRLELIKDELKIVYAKFKKSKLFKDSLVEMRKSIDSFDLSLKIGSLLKSELTPQQYGEIKDEIMNHIIKQKAKEEKELILNNVVGGLKELGYEIVEEAVEQLKAQKEVVIDIDKEYKLKVTLKESGYNIRFIKHLFNSLEPTQNERQRDREVMTKWCGDYDRLIEILAQNGLAIEHKIKLEPDIDDITYIVIESKDGVKRDALGVEYLKK